MTPEQLACLDRLAGILDERSDEVEAGARELLAAVFEEATISRLRPWPVVARRLVERLRERGLDARLADDRRDAEAASRRGASLRDLVTAFRCFDRSWLRLALDELAEADRSEAVEALGALSDRRLAALIGDFEDDSAVRLLAEQEALAAARDECRRLSQRIDALRRAESRSEHRAEQIALVNAVAHRIAPILDADGLLQAMADEIQVRAGHTYVGVVISRSRGCAGRPVGGTPGRAAPERGARPGACGRGHREGDFAPCAASGRGRGSRSRLLSRRAPDPLRDGRAADRGRAGDRCDGLPEASAEMHSISMPSQLERRSPSFWSSRCATRGSSTPGNRGTSPRRSGRPRRPAGARRQRRSCRRFGP